MIVGGDIGHKNTKIWTDNIKDSFKSTIMIDDNNSLAEENPIKLVYSGTKYAVGSKYGHYSIEEDKSIDDIFRLCLFTGLLRNTDNPVENIHLVTGLPISNYKRYREALKNSLEGLTVNCTIDNVTKVVNFDTVDVCPESVGAILLPNNTNHSSSLIIDIGGRTVDVSYFEGTRLVKTGSYDLGMLSLYSRLIKFVNEEYNLDYEVFKGEDIINNRVIEHSNECEEFNPDRFMLEHTDNILKRVKLDFPWKTSIKRFIGGGSISLHEQINKLTDFTVNVSENDLFTNAYAYYLVGVDKYGQD